MKNVLIFGIIFLLFLFACKREENFKYEGTYSVKKYCTFFALNQGTTVTCDTVLDIEIQSGSFKNQYIVLGYKIKVDNNGSFTAVPYEVGGYKFFSVSFINDSIAISTFDGGLGGGTTCNYNGRKK